MLGVGRLARPSARGDKPLAVRRRARAREHSVAHSFGVAQRERTGECKVETHYHTALPVPRPNKRGHEPIAWIKRRS